MAKLPSLGVDGVPDFNVLRSRKHDDEVQPYAFDILTLDGEDLRLLALSLRKTNLARLLARRPFSCSPGTGALRRDRARERGGRAAAWSTIHADTVTSRDRPTAPRSPWQNGYCERAIDSIRRECLDHVVVFGERHLRHLLRSYATYYNEAPTHLSVNKDAPSPLAA